MQCFRSFHTAERTIEGIEAMHVMRKGQVKGLDGRDAIGQAEFVESLFRVAAQRRSAAQPPLPQSNLCNRAVASLSTVSRRGRTYCRVKISPEVIGVLDTDAESQERRREVSLSWDRGPSFHG